MLNIIQFSFDGFHVIKIVNKGFFSSGLLVKTFEMSELIINFTKKRNFRISRNFEKSKSKKSCNLLVTLEVPVKPHEDF